MAEAYVFNIDRPTANRDIDGLRRYVKGVLTDIDSSAVSMDDLRLVIAAQARTLQLLQQLSTDYLAAVQASLADRADLRLLITALKATVDTLTTSLTAAVARIAALEANPAVRTVAVAGPVSLPLLSIGSRDVVLPLDRTLPDATYEVDPWPAQGLLGAAKFVLKARSTTSVTYTVTTTTLIAAGGTLAAICWRSA